MRKEFPGGSLASYPVRQPIRAAFQLPLSIEGWPPSNPASCKSLGHESKVVTSSAAQGGGGSFKNRKPIGEAGCRANPLMDRKVVGVV